MCYSETCVLFYLCGLIQRIALYNSALPHIACAYTKFCCCRTLHSMLDCWSIRGLLVRASGHRNDAHDTEYSDSASANTTITVYPLFGIPEGAYVLSVCAEHTSCCERHISVDASLGVGDATPNEHPLGSDQDHWVLVQMAITGMTCGSCSMAIQSALDKLPGVSAASIGLLSNSAEVQHSCPLLSKLRSYMCMDSSW